MRVFSVVGPITWNNLPSDLRVLLNRDSAYNCYKHLKTVVVFYCIVLHRIYRFTKRLSSEHQSLIAQLASQCERTERKVVLIVQRHLVAVKDRKIHRNVVLGELESVRSNDL